jgi:hypothetical protein
VSQPRLPDRRSLIRMAHAILRSRISSRGLTKQLNQQAMVNRTYVSSGVSPVADSGTVM